MASTKTSSWLLPLCSLACLMVTVYGHGRMILPPSRASAWRLGIPGAPVNYQDNEAFCGGFQYQVQQGGKCGICGDAWDSNPRDHERPDGKFVMATDFILSTYRQGDILEASIQLTAAHKGYFEFYLCNVDELHGQVEATPECLQRNKLLFADSQTYRSTLDLKASGKYSLRLQLPAGLTCDHCVLQWKYHTGNSWGVGEYGGCTGCGAQEEFYSCADLRILQNGVVPPTPAPTPRPPVSTTPAYIPPGVDEDPLSEADKEFFLCNYCMREVFGNMLTSMSQAPPVCQSRPLRMCNRMG